MGAGRRQLINVSPISMILSLSLKSIHICLGEGKKKKKENKKTMASSCRA